MCGLCLERRDCNCECKGEWKDFSEPTTKFEAVVRAQHDKKNTFICKECKHFVKSAYTNKKISVPILLKHQGYKCAIHGAECATNKSDSFFEETGSVPYDIDHKKPVNGNRKMPVALDEIWLVCLTCHRIKTRLDNKGRTEENKKLRSQISENEIKKLYDPMLYYTSTYSPETRKTMERALLQIKSTSKGDKAYKSFYIGLREQYLKLYKLSGNAEVNEKDINVKSVSLEKISPYPKELRKQAIAVVTWYFQQKVLPKSQN